MTAFFDWLAGQTLAPGLLAIDRLPIGGPFHGLLLNEVARRRAVSFVRDNYVRALLAPTCDAETYQANALAGKHRKELRRQRKRLSELGKLEMVELGADGDLEGWIHEFLALEAAGWKGRGSSAIGSRDRDTNFFKTFVRGCQVSGSLFATAIRLDGRAVAMQFLLASGQGAYAFKIAYDESYARFSPGVLLELNLVERVASGSSFRWIDSAAERNHPMIDRLWTERKTVESWLVAADSSMKLVLSLLPAARWVKQLVKPGKKEIPAAKA